MWGDAPVKSHSITVGDAGTLSITANLDSALRHLRLSERSRDVWVDALCINQKDDKERNQQVAQMGKVFGSASCVNVWLGGLDDIKDLAVEMIEASAKNSSLHWFPTDEPCMEAKFLETEHLEALIAVLKHPWWSRLWTVQETILAKDLRFMVSGNTFSREALFKLTKNLYHHQITCCAARYSAQPRPPLYRTGRYLRIVSLIEVFVSSDFPATLHELLSLFRHRRTKMAHDRIYGALGLLQGEKLISPDYSKTVSQVYEEAALAVIQEDKNLSLFSSLDRSSDLRSPLPSWVPDWDYWTDEARDIVRLRRLERISLYNACDSKRVEWTLIHPGELMLKGVLFDQLDVVGVALETNQTNKRTQVYENWHEVVENLSMRSHPYEVDGIPQVFHRTLWCDVEALVSSKYKRMRGGWQFPAYCRWWAAMLDGRLKELVETDKEARWYEDCAKESTYTRRFFTTKKGYMGLAAENVTEGDVVAVFNGARVPHVLRPADEVDGRSMKSFRISSDAYVHGIMDGEALGASTGEPVEEESLLLV